MKLFPASIILLAIANFSSLAFAAPPTTSAIWRGGSGSFENTNAWDFSFFGSTTTGSGIPDATTQAFVVLGPNGTSLNGTPNLVNLQANITQTNNESVQSLEVLGASFFVVGLGSANGGTLNYTISPGKTLTIAGDTPTLGDGGFEINGGSTVNLSGGNVQVQDGLIFVGDAFSNGASALNILSGTFSYDFQTIADGTSMVVGDGQPGAVTQGTSPSLGNTSSTVTLGNILVIGSQGSTGTYTLNNNSILQTGNQLPLFDYVIQIGANTAASQTSTGTLTLLDASSFTVGGNGVVGGDLQVGTSTGGVSGGTGIINQGVLGQAGAGPTVTMQPGSTAEIGDTNGSTGTYNLNAGTLKLEGATSIGTVSGATGTLNQTGGAIQSTGASGQLIVGDGGNGTYTFSGGTADFTTGFKVGNQTGSTGLVVQTGSSSLTAESLAVIGVSGDGTYTLGGGTADFKSGLTLGSQNGSTGTLTQSSGILTVENTVATVGGIGTGVYNLQGGSATFNRGMTVGAAGVVNQTGGTLVVTAGQNLNLSTSGAGYNLNGGTLKLSTGGLTGTTGQGHLNFGGGTLQAQSNLTDGLDGVLSNNSTLDTSLANITLTGNLIGTGGFVLNGNKTVTLNASDTFTGNTLINGSTSLNLEVVDATDKFASSISGTGNLNVDFVTNGHTLELTGTTNLTGPITLGHDGKSGTLKIFTGTFANIGQTGTGSLMIGGDASVATSGTVHLAGTNSYTGLTTVNGGFTLITNNLNGALTNSGMIQSGLTPNTLPSSPGTTFSINGAFNSTGTLLVNTNGPVSDLYTITSGSPSNVGGTVLVTGLGTTINQVILTASGGLGASTPTTAVTGAGVLFTANVTKVGNTLILNTLQAPSAGFANTPNQHAVGGAIDPILVSGSFPTGFAPLGTALDQLSASEIPIALDQLSPETLAYARDIAFENSTFLAQTVNAHLANLRCGYSGLDTSGLSIIAPGFNSSMGRSLGSLLAYNNRAPNGVDYYPANDSSSAPPLSGSSSGAISDSSSPDPLTTLSPRYAASHYDGPLFSEFVAGNVILADLNQNTNALNAAPAKASYTAGSATAGASFRITANLAVGALFDYNHTDAKTDASGSKIKVDSYSPGIYGTFFKDGFYANGLFAFGYNNYSNTRSISFAGLTAKSSPTGMQYVGNVDLGYDVQPEKHWLFGPTLGLTYTHLDIDSFNETGAGAADLNVDSQSADSLRSRLGGHLVYQTHSGSVLLQPNFTMMWQHEYLNNSSNITSEFNIPSPANPPFSIQTAAPSRDSALIGCGLTATLDNSMAVYLNYLVDVGASDYFAQSIEGGVKAQF